MEGGDVEDVEVDFVGRETSIPGFETFWEALTVGAPPVRLLFDRIGSEGQERLREVLAEIVEQRFGSGPVVLSNVATVGVGSATG